MIENYPRAYSEVVEILKYMPKEDVEKITKDMRKMFEEKRDKNYNFVVHASDDFSKLKILDETEAIFVNIFRDYWSTPEQRAKIIATQNQYKKMIEDEKEKKYSSQDIFKNRADITNTESKKIEDKSMIEYKESVFKKFISRIKRFFGAD